MTASISTVPMVMRAIMSPKTQPKRAVGKAPMGTPPKRARDFANFNNYNQ